MATMKAVGLYRYLPISDPESLLDLEVERPRPTGRDLLVKIEAVSVNPVDTKIRSPKDKVESTPKILGFDAAGIVVETGPDCKWFKPGDEVFYAGSNVRQGTNAEYHLVDERIVGRKPRSLTFAEAAALPLTSLTAWEAIEDRLGFSLEPGANRGTSLLIIGAAGGVGSIATQLAHRAGFTVIGTASRPETRAWATEHGADHVIDHTQPFRPQLEAIGLLHVDAILCLNSTDRHWESMADVIAPQGKICSIVETSTLLNLELLFGKSVTFAWELMFTRPRYQTPDMARQRDILNRVADWVDAGEIRTTMTEHLSPINAENLRKAHAKLESGRTIGKIVLSGF
ncbi:zinc-binding alcohol dehydrogenase family protein [Alicyclobacillus vulcanalis]|uniref:Zinc-type alcohol dehydrogenase-like protein n=2 Tax=Alicyclobacillus vulcanalis TaxID=252246 RepID=A0A1N7M0Y4_9BACL|nr:zinc-binding alcohol dehydrogenase family protein [Alicyclobacillus vulcanalis]SIS79770.1 zinc-binding alcohol dehydrogenase family protein [Alicyclobacillus vulcanalis]